MPEECTHNCETCSLDCDSRENGGIQKAQLNPRASVRHVIGVISGKGGVGKSMTTSLIATLLRRNGSQVAILDADMTGPSIPTAFGLHEKMKGDAEGNIEPALTQGGIQVISTNLLLPDETEPVVWRGPMIAGMVTNYYSEVIWNDVDYMVIDMPPGTGDVPLTVFQQLPVEGLIVVTSPQELVSMIVTKAVKMADMLTVPILGIIENMSFFECPNCHERHEIYGASHVEELVKLHSIPTMARIPFLPDLAHACDTGTIENWALENFKNIDPQNVTEKNTLQRVTDMITYLDKHFNN